MRNVQDTNSGNTDIKLALTGLTVGRTYKYSAYIKEGTQAGAVVHMKVLNNAENDALAEKKITSTDSWVEHYVVWKATETNPKIFFSKFESFISSLYATLQAKHLTSGPWREVQNSV